MIDKTPVAGSRVAASTNRDSRISDRRFQFAPVRATNRFLYRRRGVRNKYRNGPQKQNIWMVTSHVTRCASAEADASEPPAQCGQGHASPPLQYLRKLNNQSLQRDRQVVQRRWTASRTQSGSLSSGFTVTVQQPKPCRKMRLIARQKSFEPANIIISSIYSSNHTRYDRILL